MSNKQQLAVLSFAVGIVLLCNACGSLSASRKQQVDNDVFPAFSYEGHRGARGLYPENTIGAMKVAIDLPKVTTLEMDCHITKDNQVVVFHDDVLNPKFMTYVDGKPLAGKDIKGAIYGYTYAELAKFDLGSKFYKDFPEQKKVKSKINLLSELIDAAEAYAKEKRTKPMFYNIETKSQASKDEVYHPKPKEFSDLVLRVVINKGIASRTVIQSFDKRTIQYINKKYPQIKTSYIIGGDSKKSIAGLLDELGFKPFIISPYHELVTPDFVKQAHDAGIKVTPWTLNEKQKIIYFEALKVDGIISDYPNLF